MDRRRIYLDTSVLGGCFDAEFETWSNGLMRDCRAGRLVPVLSDVTAAEVVEAPQVVRDLHQELVGLAEPLLTLTPEVENLVAVYALSIFNTAAPLAAPMSSNSVARRTCPVRERHSSLRRPRSRSATPTGGPRFSASVWWRHGASSPPAS